MSSTTSAGQTISLATPPKNGSQDQWSGPLFVIGVYRSGTSLLYSLLNQHPKIALLYESDLTHGWSMFFHPWSRSNWPERWDLWHGAVSRHRIDVRNIPSQITDPAAVAAAVLKDYANQKGAVIWGEKSPVFHDELSSLQRNFPNARFIIIWRDPLAVCRSILRAGNSSSFFGKRGMTLRAILGMEHLKQECDRLISSGSPVCQIHYEEMVSAPAGTMRTVCEFLEIPFDSRMTSLVGADRSAIPEGEHHNLVRSESIRSHAQYAENLPPGLKKKIERYVIFWRGKYGAWPAHPRSMESHTGKLTAFDRVVDHGLFWLLGKHDAAVRWIYSVAPIGLIKTYRTFKKRRSAPISDPKSTAPASDSKYHSNSSSHRTVRDKADTFAKRSVRL